MTREIALLLGLLGVTGCTNMPDDSCVARGTKTNVQGQLTTTLTIGSGAPVASTTAQTLVVNDYTQSCTYDQEEFPVEILGCRVFVRLEPQDQHKDDKDPIPAVVVGGQSCTLALPEGPTTVSIGSGELTFVGGVPSFSMDAAVGAMKGVSTLGTLTVVLVADSP